MHPGFYYHWKRAKEAHEHESAEHAGRGCGWKRRRRGANERYWAGGSAFGVRRPLRTMAHRLDLDDEQVSKLAQILNELKTERAQASVDEQRSISAIAEGIQGESFDAERVSEGLELRVQSATRLKAEITKALERTHRMLDNEQRERLAYLLRSGQLSI
ncbi:MAG: Spy/CpxP family protein refolding chaperone [Myxococcota bacterium]